MEMMLEGFNTYVGVLVDQYVIGHGTMSVGLCRWDVYYTA